MELVHKMSNRCSSGSSSDVVLAWSSCQFGVHCTGGVSIPSQFQDTGPQLLVVLPRTYHWHWPVVERARGVTPFLQATQCSPTGTGTTLDDTRSRNCGFFGRQFPSQFPPVSNRASPAESVLLGGWVVNISQAHNKNCVFPPSVLDSLSTWMATQCEQFASATSSSCSCFAQPFLEHAGRNSSGQSSIAISDRSPSIHCYKWPRQSNCWCQIHFVSQQEPPTIPIYISVPIL